MNNGTNRNFVFVALLTLVLLLQTDNAVVSQKMYVWEDGTTAPIECVEICKQKGVDIEYNANEDVHYLREECKIACYGEDAILEPNTNRPKKLEITVVGEETDEDMERRIKEAQQRIEKQEGERNFEAPEPVEKTRENETEQVRQTENRGSDTSKIVLETVEQKRRNIEDTIEQRSRIHLDELNNISLNMSKNEIGVGGEQISAVAKTIGMRIKNREINLVQNQKGVLIEDDEFSAQTESVEITESGELRVSGFELGILPSQVQREIRGDVKELNLMQRNNELIYEATANRNARFLGIFQIEYEVISQYNAQNGELKGSNKPLWSIFAFE